MYSLFSFLFPSACCICNRHGNYICHHCKKLLKRNLPECYICRRISPSYVSHLKCKNPISLDNVFVAWEYNYMSSNILKQYKYKNVRDISFTISELFIDTIRNSTFKKNLLNTLLIPVPISELRMCERGFNQMDYITANIAKSFNQDMCKNFIYCKNSKGHQANKNKIERYNSKFNPFYIKNHFNIDNYKSITIVDDVITTGNTLEKMSKIIKTCYGSSTEINALCLFRGKPYFISE